jgi:hypothetical protein
MKWWKILLAVVGISIAVILIVPPGTRCKWAFWDKNACATVQQAAQDLGKLGVDVDPNMPFVTQIDEFASPDKLT